MKITKVVFKKIIDETFLSERRMAIKEGFYRVELINTVWEVPNRYQNLMPVGNGAFGQVRILQFGMHLFQKGNSKVIKLNVERGCSSATRGCVSFCLNKNQNKFTILPCKISGQFVHWGLSYIHHHHYHL